MTKTTTCINEAVGTQLPQYEMDMLSAEERDRFEIHVLDCEFCRNEMQAFQAAATILHQDRALIREELRRKGMTLEAVLSQFVAADDSPIRSVSGDTSSFGERIMGWLRPPWVWVPALGVACVAILIALTGPIGESKYQGLVIFDPLPYNGDVLRGGDEAEAAFQLGIESYQAANYKKAVSNFKKAVEADAKHGPAWLYLGTSYFMQEKATEAIAALTQSSKLVSDEDYLHSQWYLAQSYLLAGTPAQARPILDEIAKAGDEHSTQAAVLRDMIDTLN